MKNIISQMDNDFNPYKKEFSVTNKVTDDLLKAVEELQEKVFNNLVAITPVTDNIVNGVFFHCNVPDFPVGNRFEFKFTLNGKEHHIVDTLGICKDISSINRTQTLEMAVSSIKMKICTKIAEELFSQTNDFWVELFKNRL
jgi:hypothetical protein